ncbi:MAG: hypothetical protein UFA98_07245 [Ruminococcus sp.]|nr:hypothetical protein [Ruminococcus sp.]
MKKRSLLFIIPTVILAGILVFAVINALIIYIPQEEAQRNFEDLKESVRIAASSTGVSGDGAQNNKKEATAKQNADNGNNQSVKKTSPENDFDGLGKLSRDYVGWLTIDDSIIDYPVMKSSEDDPEYYLHRDFYGNDSFSGCLFIGEGCDSESESFVIYGHNMNNDSMFGALDE